MSNGKVIKKINMNRLKHLEYVKWAKKIGTNKMLGIAGTVGLSLWLFSNAIGSKRFNQEDY